MSFINKIKEFYITLSLGEYHRYLVGATVEGKVIIDPTKAKRTTGPLRITLSGRAIVQWGQAPALRSNAQTLFDDMTVYLWGTGAESLAPGKHEFPYTFQLPTDIPSSLEDFYGHIRYILTAVLPTRKGEVIRQKRINIRGIVDVDRPDLLNSLNDSDSKTLGCCCCTSTIELSASIDRGGYLCGETIHITERHGCRRITSAHATLLRKTVYHARTISASTAESNFSYKCIAAAPVLVSRQAISDPDARVGKINIPNNTVPSINCDVLTVSYCVHVTLEFKLPMVKRLSVMIPITIGNMRSMAGIGEGLPLPNSPVQPTATPTLRSLSNTLQGSAIRPTPAAHVGAYPVSDAASLQPMLSTFPSAPLEPIPNTMPNAPMEPVVNTVPSAPVYPMPNTLPIASAPTLPDDGATEAPDTPPPLYSEF